MTPTSTTTRFGRKARTTLAVGLLALILAVSAAPALAVDVNVALGAACPASDIGKSCGTEDAQQATCQEAGTARVVCRQAPCSDSSPCPSGMSCADLESGGDTYKGCIAGAAPESAEGVTPSVPIAPTLSIDIPTVDLRDAASTITGDYQYIDMPWIADYITGVYRYAVFAGSIMATVMIMIGGFQWLTSAGNSSRVTAAKERITNAVVGLLLVIGSYIILNTINPDLTMLNSLRVKIVRRSEMDVVMQSTDVNTGEPENRSSGSASSYGGSGRGTYTPQHFTSCPITLSNPLAPRNALPGPHRDPRTIEFQNNIGRSLTGTTRQKVVQVAEASLACQVHFGACGRTTGAFNALAGVGNDTSCFADDNGCWNEGSRSPGIGRTQRRMMDGRRCTETRTTNCYSSSGEATRAVYNEMSATMPSDWPDSWADQLEPGDKIIIYNGNSSRMGTHAAIFVGWAGNGRAQLLQGAYGRITYSTDTCITTRCSGTRPLVYVMKPE